MSAYYVLEYTMVDDFLEKRTPYRPEHLGLLQAALDRGELLYAGALPESARGLMIFKADDRAVVEEFARNDPYTKNGVTKSWTVAEWVVAVGGDA